MSGWFQRLVTRLGFRRPLDNEVDASIQELHRQQEESIERISRIYGVSADLIRARIEEGEDAHRERA